MNDFVNSFAYWLADYGLTTTVLLVAVLVAIRCCRQPVKRLAVAKAAIVAMFVLAGLCAVPGWSVVSLGWPEAKQVASPPTEVAPPVDRSQALVATGEVPRKPIALAAEAPLSFVASPARKSGSLSWPVFVELSYFVGSAGIVLWLLAGALAARRMVRRAQPAPANLTDMLRRIESDRPTAADLLVSDEFDVAAALGILRPRILLPQQWVSARSNHELSTVLAHEVAHIHNGDLAWLAASRILLILQWAQPMYWLLRRSMRLDQETLADVAAAEHSGRQEYAEQLVAWAREVSARPRLMLPAAVGLWESPSQLRRRLARLLDERLTMLRRCSLGWVITTSILIVALAALLSTATFAPLAVAEAGEDESTADAMSAAGVRTLPNGITVEVLAIGDKSDSERPDRWWRPDGTPLVSVPFRVGRGSAPPSDDQSSRQFVMRVPGLPPDATVRWHVTNMVGGAYRGEVVLDGQESPPGYYSQVFCISKHQASFGLRVHVAVGDWNTIARTSPKGGGIGLSHQGVIFSRAYTVLAPQLEEGTGIVITHDFVDKDVRAIAVDRDGKQHTANRTSVTSTTNVLVQLDFSRLKIGQVDHFEFQTRDFESVAFDDLSAQPDQRAVPKPYSIKDASEPPASSVKAIPVAVNELAGQVVDEAGQPIAGAIVDAWTWHPGNETTTDDQGLFRLTGFDRREPVEVEFTKSGYCPRLFVAQATGVANWKIELNSRTFLEGRVTDADGEAVASARLRASRGPFQNPHVSIGEVWTETNTDADGKYRIYLEPDTYDVQLRVPGVGLARHERTVLRDIDQKRLDIQLQRGPAFRAVVRDSVTNEPVEGIRLWSWLRPGIEGASNSEGILKIDNMLPGDFEFNVSAVDEESKFSDVAGDYARWWSPDAINERERLVLDEGRDGPQQNLGFQRNFDDLEFDVCEGMEPVTIVVERCVQIRGLVVDPNGKSVAGATVAPAKTGSGNSLTGDTRYSVRTAADGTFEMRLPASGAATYNLVAHDGDYEQWRTWANGIGELMQTKPGDVVENVRLQLSTPCVVRGRVEDANGQPVSKHQVHAQSADKLESRIYDPTTETDEQGEFELRFVRPGKHYIQAEPFYLPADSGPQAAWRLVATQPDHPTEGVVFTIPAETPKSQGIFQMEAVLAPPPDAK